MSLAWAQKNDTWYAYSDVTDDMATDVFVIRTNGSGHKRLTTNGLSADPFLTPDNKRIVYTSDDQIWSMRVDGGDKRRLARIAGWECRFPAVSPQGDRIAFTAWKQVPGELEAYTMARLYQMNADGSGLVALRSRPVNPAGPAPTELFSHPAWSPDGKRIVYGDVAPGRSALFVLSLAAKTARQITGTRGGKNEYDCHAPAYSPDGTRIACRSFGRFGDENSARQGVVVLNADGTNPRWVFTGDVTERVRWSGDGKSLLFTTLRGLHRLDVAKRSVRTVPLPRTF